MVFAERFLAGRNKSAFPYRARRFVAQSSDFMMSSPLVAPVVLRYLLFFCALCSGLLQAAPVQWQDDLQPLPSTEWNRERAAHLLERAGFGATPEEVRRFAAMTPVQVVRHLVRYQKIKQNLPAFQPSDSFDAGLDPFASSRPAATDLARDKGEALGVKVKPAGNRRMQQVADRFLIGCARASWKPSERPTGGRTGCW
jgi:hypothetical protein